jgi:hypothetical protein
VFSAQEEADLYCHGVGLLYATPDPVVSFAATKFGVWRSATGRDGEFALYGNSHSVDVARSRAM